MARALSIFPSREALIEATTQRLAEAITQALTLRGAACVALSGGTTPAPVYRKLAARELDWRHVSFVLVDERFVPVEHEASNEGMLRAALGPALDHGAALVPMYAPALTHEAAAARANTVYAPLEIDIALMGMGADAHTASWFPGALGDALDPVNPRSVVAVTAPGAAGAVERLTLTLAKLARARRLLLLITGEDKRAALEAAARSAPSAAPIAALFNLGAPLEILWAA